MSKPVCLKVAYLVTDACYLKCDGILEKHIVSAESMVITISYCLMVCSVIIPCSVLLSAECSLRELKWI